MLPKHSGRWLCLLSDDNREEQTKELQFECANVTTRGEGAHKTALVKREQDVVARLDDAIRARDRGALGLAPGQMPTVGEWMDIWLASKYELKPKTVQRYRTDIDLYIKQVADMDPAILMHLISNYDSYDATAWLHELKVPALVIAGEKDHVIPLEQQELMHQLLPNSRLEVVRHGSHCPQMDLPELFNQHIEKFLSQLDYR